MTGWRVVLLMARGTEIEGNNRLASALEQIEKGPWELVAVVDPERRIEALRMVLDGLADRLVLMDPADFPVCYAADLNVAGRASALAGRTRPVLRSPADQQPASGIRRQP